MDLSRLADGWRIDSLLNNMGNHLPLVWIETKIVDSEKQRRDTTGHLFRDDLPAGVARWSVIESVNQGKKCLYRSLAYMCPGGCGQIGHVPVTTAEGYRDGWNWDGNLELPTLQPSIQMLAGCRWHGHLVKGIWQQC
jgi:hypothetical protein